MCFSTGFPRVPNGTKCACTEMYWEFLTLLPGTGAPRRHAGLCIQTVAPAAASLQPPAPKPPSLLHPASRFALGVWTTARHVLPYQQSQGCLRASGHCLLRTQHPRPAQEQGRRKTLLLLCIIPNTGPKWEFYPIRHDAFSQQNPFSGDFISHYFLLLRPLTVACFSLWLKRHHSARSSGAFV